MTVKLLAVFFIILSICFGGLFYILEKSDANAIKRKQMVTGQLKTRDIKDPVVLSAMEKVPRHRFVPEALRKSAYSDEPLPIANDQTITQPYIVALMTQALALEPDDRVLEIGTGSGYQAAILGEIVREVFTVEIIPSLSVNAQALLSDLGYRNIFYKIGDGHEGWAENAPYDAIIVTAALKEIPEELIRQIKMGGRLIAPVGDSETKQDLYLLTKTPEGVYRDKIIPVRFVPMVHSKK